MPKFKIDDGLTPAQRYYRKNIGRRRELARNYYRENREEICRKRREFYQGWGAKERGQDKQRRIACKLEVLTHYGNGKCACVKCGFADIRALSIDHINGGGNIHRKEIKVIGGTHFYRRLKIEEYPNGYQTLCMNCQMIKKAENKEVGTKFKEALYNDCNDGR